MHKWSSFRTSTFTLMLSRLNFFKSTSGLSRKTSARIVCALAVRGGSPVSWMYVVMCRLGLTGCNSSGLYLGRSLFESYIHSKWLFRRTSWCLMVSSHPRLIVWELKCLKWLFSSVIVVTGKSWQAHGDTQCSVVLGIAVHFKVHKSNPTSPWCVLGTQRILSLGGWRGSCILLLPCSWHL